LKSLAVVREAQAKADRTAARALVDVQVRTAKRAMN